MPYQLGYSPICLHLQENYNILDKEISSIIPYILCKLNYIFKTFNQIIIISLHILKYFIFNILNLYYNSTITIDINIIN